MYAFTLSDLPEFSNLRVKGWSPFLVDNTLNPLVCVLCVWIKRLTSCIYCDMLYFERLNSIWTLNLRGWPRCTCYRHGFCTRFPCWYIYHWYVCIWGVSFLYIYSATAKRERLWWAELPPAHTRDSSVLNGESACSLTLLGIPFGACRLHVLWYLP